ncbi:hypothetical protein HHK36_021741 [Tetracentron sinense]|uniref:Uncharacterized protein n=1 Tax=Tetracentron sinense TaxID=13715 RepID=A0A835DA83_TETSI|nr:hypothetical protein HHK36_021741 [Tetracentron sinense]
MGESNGRISRAMGRSELSVVSGLKREECKRTKHDSVFSPWKILIGPSDWENHSLGKEGIDRYRIDNLPISSSCPGLYELGIAASHTDLGRKLDPDKIVVVYLGQADNVRTRLQHYGRAGSHLDNGNSICHPSENKSSCLHRGPGLFRQIFLRGFPIVFRWAPVSIFLILKQMENKKDAEKTEAKLLDFFDYAWNRGGNGARRPDDILLKLNKYTSSTTPFFKITRNLQQWKWDDPFSQKQVGIRIKAKKLLSTDTEQEIDDLRSRIIKFGRSQPRLVSNRFGVNDDFATICGVALSDGSVCRRQPVEGRKRCAEHKGRRINGSISKLVIEGNSHVPDVSMESKFLSDRVSDDVSLECKFPSDRVSDDLRTQISKSGTSELVSDRCVVDEDLAAICGLALGDGSVCRRRPAEGRKRCAEHKGSRINWSMSKIITEGNSNVRVGLESKFHSDWASDDFFKSGRSDRLLISDRFVANEESAAICGVALGNGSICGRRPVEGRKRCEEHKGRRISVSVSKLVTEGNSHVRKSQVYFVATGSLMISLLKLLMRNLLLFVGWPWLMALFVEGRQLKEERDARSIKGGGLIDQKNKNKGRRISVSVSKLVTEGNLHVHDSDWDSDDLPSQIFKSDASRLVWHRIDNNEDFTNICGVALGDGSDCRRRPVEGRKRCGEHKGKRVVSSITGLSHKETHLYVVWAYKMGLSVWQFQYMEGRGLGDTREEGFEDLNITVIGAFMLYEGLYLCPLNNF